MAYTIVKSTCKNWSKQARHSNVQHPCDTFFEIFHEANMPAMRGCDLSHVAIKVRVQGAYDSSDEIAEMITEIPEQV